MSEEKFEDIERERYYQIARKVESLLISAGYPISLGKIRNILNEITLKDLKVAIELLNAFYDETRRAFHILEVAGGYQIYTRPQFAEIVGKLFTERESKLSQSSLETAAIVAYKQPITKAEIEKIRGVSVDSPVKTLMDRNLIRVIGRGDGPGRPVIYGTTQDFLKYFQINALKDLPPMDELTEFELTQEEINTTGVK